MENENSEGKETKIGFNAYYYKNNIESLLPNMVVPPRMTPVTSVSYGTLPSHRVFGGKICNVWRRQDGAPVTSCHQRAFLFTNTRLFYVTATG